MGPLDLALHLLNFAVPAVFVAVCVSLGARFFLRQSPQKPSWWVQGAMNVIAGLIALGVGLWYFGQDGRIATYAALVVAVALSQWLVGRSWGRQ